MNRLDLLIVMSIGEKSSQGFLAPVNCPSGNKSSETSLVIADDHNMSHAFNPHYDLLLAKVDEDSLQNLSTT